MEPIGEDGSAITSSIVTAHFTNDNDSESKGQGMTNSEVLALIKAQQEKNKSQESLVPESEGKVGTDKELKVDSSNEKVGEKVDNFITRAQRKKEKSKADLPQSIRQINSLSNQRK